MVDTYKLQFNGNTITYPGWNGYCDYTLTGTFTDVLYQSTVVGGVSAGTLSGSIYDYDMITIYPRNIGAAGEMNFGTKFCPKDITNVGRSHYHCVNGGGNMYMTDAIISWDNGSAFTSSPVSTSHPGMRLTGSMSVSGTTAKYVRFSDYATTYAGINKIVGTKYFGTRDLLYSASNTAKLPQTISLTQPFTAYDRLQVKVSNNQSYSMADNNYERAGYWSEYYGVRETGTFHTDFVAGGGGACYLYAFIGGWNNSKSLTVNNGKPLVWSVTSTAAVTQTPNNSGYYYVSEIWGVK